jgi:hypothetical protein
LLVKGEPGTGKTVLALEIAKSLAAPLLEWHVKSTTKALQGLYEYDAVSRLRDSQLGDERVKDIRNYIKRGKLWDAFVADERPGAADRRDRQGRYRVSPTTCCRNSIAWSSSSTRPARPIKARRRPIVVITSNNEKSCPTHSCAAASFTTSASPTPTRCGDHRSALSRHQATSGGRGAQAVLRDPRRAGDEEEALDLRASGLAQAADGRRHRPGNLRERDPKKLIPPLHGALLKNEQDVHLFERLAFMARREGR